MSQRKQKAQPAEQSVFDGLQPVTQHVAGIDIGSRTHFVSVPEDRDPQPVREFGCFTCDLEALADWLHACGIRVVVMEATGVYWIPVFRVLEARAFTVVLVDGRQARHVPGRKSDVFDCTWLRRLHTYGLLHACFVPTAQVAELREYWRWRAGLVADAARQLLLIQKALEQMNLHLHKVLSDISGVSGLRILEAIVAGERNPAVLAALADTKVKAKPEEIVAALTGHWRPEQLYCLSDALAAYRYYQRRIEAVDQQVQACLAGFPDHPERERPVTAPPATRRKNEPHFDLGAELARIDGVDLTRIEGIKPLTAQVILAELGPDLSAFRSAKAFCSWLGLCPNNRVSGGKAKSRRTRKVAQPVAQGLRLAAQALERSDSALGAFYRRLKARLGAPKAITAAARKLATLIYHLITKGEAYVAQGQAEYEAQFRQHQERAFRKQAQKLGFTILEPAPGGLVS